MLLEKIEGKGRFGGDWRDGWASLDSVEPYLDNDQTKCLPMIIKSTIFVFIKLLLEFVIYKNFSFILDLISKIHDIYRRYKVSPVFLKQLETNKSKVIYGWEILTIFIKETQNMNNPNARCNRSFSLTFSTLNNLY